MRNMFTKVAAAAAILAGASTSASAFVVLTLTDFDVTTNSIDAQKSCSTFDAASVASCTALGFIAVVGGNTVTFGTTLQGIGGGFATSGVLGSFRIGTTSGISNTPGTAFEATTDRSQTSATRLFVDGNVQRLLVDFQSFNYSAPTSLFKTLSAAAGVTANLGSFSATDSVTSFFSVDANNGLGITASVTCTLTPISNPLNESCGLGPVPWTDNGGLFSMRSIQRFDIAVGTTMNSSSNSAVNNVPEPMTTALVAVALLGVGFATRRNAKKA